MTPEVKVALKILPKSGAISPLVHNILLPLARFPCLNRPDFHVEISGYSTTVDMTLMVGLGHKTSGQIKKKLRYNVYTKTCCGYSLEVPH